MRDGHHCEHTSCSTQNEPLVEPRLHSVVVLPTELGMGVHNRSVPGRSVVLVFAPQHQPYNCFRLDIVFNMIITIPPPETVSIVPIMEDNDRHTVVLRQRRLGVRASKSERTHMS